MRKLWTEDRVTFEGQYYKTENATIYDRPKEPVPLYVAASGPTAAKMAGQVADGFICTSGKAPRALHRDTAAQRRGGPRGGGRAPTTLSSG